MDQTPSPFEYLDGQTYQLTGAKTVQAKAIKSGWHKRQATLIISASGDGQLLKIILIFRGEGLIPHEELAHTIGSLPPWGNLLRSSSPVVPTTEPVAISSDSEGEWGGFSDGEWGGIESIAARTSNGAMDFLSQSLTVVECMSPEGKYVTPLVIYQSKAGPLCGWFREYRKEDYWYTTAEKGFNNTAVD